MTTVEIPIQPEDEARFFHYVKLYGMKATRRGRNNPYFTVEFEDPLTLYWLGANMFGDATGGRPLLQHGPGNVIKVTPELEEDRRRWERQEFNDSPF